MRRLPFNLAQSSSIFLKTEDCEGSHMHCRVTLCLGKHGVLNTQNLLVQCMQFFFCSLQTGSKTMVCKTVQKQTAMKCDLQVKPNSYSQRLRNSTSQ